jgi:histidinol-phosphatase (PHP family)
LKELDIPVIVNSDCHYPDKITAGFPEAYAALNNAGIKEVYQLSGAGWEPVDIRTSI